MIWFVVITCLGVSFIFSGIEAGIFSVNRVRLKHRVKLRDPAAVRLDRLLAEPERLLVTVLIVTNLSNIFAITLAAEACVVAYGRIGYLVAFFIALPVYLLGLELLPKSLFRRFPYRALAAFTGPLRLADFLLSPVHAIGSACSRSLFKKRPAPARKLFGAREDFKYLTIESERTGSLGKVERQMIHNVVDFRAVTAKEVLRPLAEVQTIDAATDLRELFELSRSTGLDRFPVLGSSGEITGLILVFEVALAGRKSGLVGSYQRRIVKVAENEPAYSVLRKLRAAGIALAVVSDSQGKQLGVVTWEDLIRRLVSVAAA